jgi:hypothetical protein
MMLMYSTRRVGPGRRVFGFFFNNLPTEPLVFIQVALVDSVSTSIQKILTEDDLSAHQNPQKLSCATFYSITTQRGLSGINLGNFLIKRVVRDLKKEFPQIQTFATLSPIPGFRGWLRNQVEVNEEIRRELEGVDYFDSAHVIEFIYVMVAKTSLILMLLLFRRKYLILPIGYVTVKRRMQ